MTDDDDLTLFAVFGLFQDRLNPKMISALDKDDAKAQYHQMYPGWGGTTLYVKTVEEMLEETDGR